MSNEHTQINNPTKTINASVYTDKTSSHVAEEKNKYILKI